MKSSNILGTLLLAASVIMFISSYDIKSDVKAVASPGNSKAVARENASLPTAPLLSASAELPPDPNYNPEVGEIYWEMEPRPYAATQKSAKFAWTAEDGRKPQVMRKFANNRENYNQLAAQNAWVKERQLVYLPEDFQKDAEAIFRGELKEFTIPGLNGQEFKLKIGQVVRTEEDQPSTGYFYGFMDGQDDAVVYLSSVGDTWSIGIDQPKLNRFYQLDTRVKGEIIVTEIDPIAKDLASGHNCSNKKGGLTSVDDVGKISGSL